MRVSYFDLSWLLHLLVRLIFDHWLSLLQVLVFILQAFQCLKNYLRDSLTLGLLIAASGCLVFHIYLIPTHCLLRRGPIRLTFLKKGNEILGHKELDFLNALGV